MTTTAPLMTTVPSAPKLRDAVEAACARFAPTWPLDRLVAVNPLWGYVDMPIDRAAAEQAVLTGARFLPERAAAGEPAGVEPPGSSRIDAAPAALATIVDLADDAGLAGGPWRTRVLHDLSEHLAAHYDRGQAAWSVARHERLLAGFVQHVTVSDARSSRRTRAQYARALSGLPAEPMEVIRILLARLGLPPHHATPYCIALLATVRGWASWCAHERWQASLAQRRNDDIVELLAARLVWEWLLVDCHGGAALLPEWRAGFEQLSQRIDRERATRQDDWRLLRAREFAYQRQLARGLRGGSARARDTDRTVVQAVFCIDVRSERMRRALERCSDGHIATRGFAGFFGLPMAFSPLGVDATRPQLPALLAPGLVASQHAGGPDDTGRIAAARRTRLAGERLWRRFRSAPGSAFTFVETFGGAKLVDLVRRSLGLGTQPEHPDHVGLSAAEQGRLRTVLQATDDADGLAQRVDLAGRILRGIGLTRDLAPLVLLVGHASSTTCNPHAAGLDCGACGGQSGEANARALADLLQDGAVRAGLAAAGITIPAGTRFVAGVHDTTLDVVTLFDTADRDAGGAEPLATVRQWLATASALVRRERAPGLGLTEVDDDGELASRLRRRSRDWAETRPEWGLAGNAAFVAAPRARTAHLDLNGRVFLHEYDWRADDGFAGLTQIMTAPMVVAHWINMQYYASTVDPRVFGSGNKVLHNVAAGGIGVFEGNGGDLRIGLPRQSVHDGERYVHEPLRLSVFLEAPIAAIEDVVAAQSIVAQLVDNGWLHLLAIAPDGAVVRRRAAGDWEQVDVSGAIRGGASAGQGERGDG